MKVYVVIIDISNEFYNTIYVELFKNKKEAEEYMKEQFETEIKSVEYDTIERGTDILSAYNADSFAENHYEIKLLEKEVS